MRGSIGNMVGGHSLQNGWGWKNKRGKTESVYGAIRSLSHHGNSGTGTNHQQQQPWALPMFLRIGTTIRILYHPFVLSIPEIQTTISTNPISFQQILLYSDSIYGFDKVEIQEVSRSSFIIFCDTLAPVFIPVRFQPDINTWRWTANIPWREFAVSDKPYFIHARHWQLRLPVIILLQHNRVRPSCHFSLLDSPMMKTQPNIQPKMMLVRIGASNEQKMASKRDSCNRLLFRNTNWIGSKTMTVIRAGDNKR